MTEKAGTLHVVATPIGNLEDISIRAIAVLKNADLILCEDTRHFGRLKNSYSIETKVLSYHEHNELKRVENVLNLLKEGANVALVSDAGTPLISDPGYRLVKACREHNFQVSPIPGPSACIAAISCSGCETDQFCFLGFLPQKDGKKRKLLEKYLALEVPLIFYESPYRVSKTLKLLDSILSSQQVFCARELTKIHEEIRSGRPLEILKELEDANKIKGEFVIIIGKPSSDGSHTNEKSELAVRES